MDKPKLLLITDTCWPIRGGVEETIRTLAAGLPPAFRVAIATHAGPQPYGRTLHGFCAPRPFAEYVDPAGQRIMPLLPDAAGRAWLAALRLWDLPGVKRKYAPRLFDALYPFYRKAYLPRLKSLVRDASLAHCFSTGYLARCTAEACANLDLPLVLTPAIHFGRWGDSPGQIAAYAAADAIIGPTGYFKKQLLGLTGPAHAEIEIIPPFIREPVAGTVPPPGVAVSKPFVLFLGRRVRYKGMEMLLNAQQMIGDAARVVIAGPPVRQPISQKGVNDLGEAPEPVKQWLLDNCALLCVPSEDESFGMVYAEAMQSGRPVVALDIPVLRELVEDGVTGLLVPPGDTGALAVAIKRIVSDRALQERMGKAGRKRFEEKFAGKRSMEKIVALYNRVLTKREKDIKI